MSAGLEELPAWDQGRKLLFRGQLRQPSKLKRRGYPSKDHDEIPVTSARDLMIPRTVSINPTNRASYSIRERNIPSQYIYK